MPGVEASCALVRSEHTEVQGCWRSKCLCTRQQRGANATILGGWMDEQVVDTWQRRLLARRLANLFHIHDNEYEPARFAARIIDHKAGTAWVEPRLGVHTDEVAMCRLECRAVDRINCWSLLWQPCAAHDVHCFACHARLLREIRALIPTCTVGYMYKQTT